MSRQIIKLHPWAWVPTLYFAEGMPNVIVVTMSVLMYKNLGISNTQIALFTSLIYLPWVIKPLWSPIVDIISTKRRWIVGMQFAMAAAFVLIGGSVTLSCFLLPSLILLSLLAMLSATHDIAADGFYMLALTERQQSYFVGVRSAFYRLATVAVTGGSPWLTGLMMRQGMSAEASWAIMFAIIGGLFASIGCYHQRVLPRPATDHGMPDRTVGQTMAEFGRSFGTFFTKPGIGCALTFMLLYRLPESLLQKLITPFLVDPVDVGGLGLSNEDVGTVYGIIGVIGLLVGGIVGGLLISRDGLRHWLMPMALSLVMACGAFVVLSSVDSPSFILVNVMVFVEQFGYGFGFSAYMLYLIFFARGQFATSHYAIATGFMAMGLMLPGLVAGALQEMLDYTGFFRLTLGCCVFTVGVSLLVLRKIPADFGRKGDTKS